MKIADFGHFLFSDVICMFINYITKFLVNQESKQQKYKNDQNQFTEHTINNMLRRKVVLLYRNNRKSVDDLQQRPVDGADKRVIEHLDIDRKIAVGAILENGTCATLHVATSNHNIGMAFQ